MNKLVAWILGFTKLGKVAEPVQKWISGKGTYLSAAAAGIPALIIIIQKFADQGLPYLSTVLTSPEYITLCAAVATVRIRLAITKAANPAKDPNSPIPS
jgi:hypothetical protein